jgi:6-phosphogluconate dehydrogenase
MMMLVMAGKPVDDFIELILNEGGAEEGDIIIDGGNSHYPVSLEERRVPVTDLASCPVVTRRRGHTSR